MERVGGSCPLCGGEVDDAMVLRKDPSDHIVVVGDSVYIYRHEPVEQ